MTRSLKQNNYFVLETEAQGYPCWTPYPGQLRQQAFSHVASGAALVEYWHWHSIHNSFETYWSCLLYTSAMHQDIRPLNVLILNLMPTKVITENQLLRKISNTPLQIKVEFLQTASYTPQHVDTEHMESFYTTFEQVKDLWFDGLIITGAPLAFVPYEEVH